MGNRHCRRPSDQVKEKDQVEILEEENISINVTGSFNDYTKNYALHHELGRGKYGVVRTVSNKETKERFAMKTVEKKKLSKIDSLKTEIKILQELSHPNIMGLFEIFEDAHYIHLITELCLGGELFDRIQEKTKKNDGEGCFSEDFAIFLVRQILDGVQYLHRNKVIHRDLKPENFLLVDRTEKSQLKIIDFGLATYEPENDEYLTERVGTPYYCAPEVLQKRYKKSCDVWSIGIITYILLCGYPPFVGKDTKEQFLAIQSAKLSFEDDVWKTVSNEAKSFIRGLLRRDPTHRPTASSALRDRWLSGNSHACSSFASCGVPDCTENNLDGNNCNAS